MINEWNKSVREFIKFLLFNYVFILMLLLLFSIVHFTVAGANEAEVDLVLMQFLSSFTV